MAQAKRTSRLFGAAAGVLAGAAVALTPVVGNAQDAQPASSQVPDGWTAELWELNQAAEAVTAYARENSNGVGILLHVGDDLRARAQAAAEKHSVPVDHALQVMINRVEQSYADQFAAHGVEVRLFPRANLDARGTGLSYHIGQLVYEDASGDPLLSLGKAREEIPRVVEALGYLNAQANLDVDQPALNGFGG